MRFVLDFAVVVALVLFVANSAAATEWEEMPEPGRDVTELLSQWEATARGHIARLEQLKAAEQSAAAEREKKANEIPPHGDPVQNFDQAFSNHAATRLDESLLWLKRHQSPDGSWKAESYPINCPLLGPKAEPETGLGEWGLNGPDRDVVLTAAALCALIVGGYDHRTPSAFRPTVKRGIDWILVAGRQSDGSFSFDNYYAHVFATLVLAEFHAMTLDTDLHDPAQQAVDYLIAQALTRERGLVQEVIGWPVNSGSEVVDLESTLLAIMAIKSAQAAFLDTGRSLVEVRHWFRDLLRFAHDARNDDQSLALPLRSSPDFSQMYGEASECGLAAIAFLGISQQEEPLLAALGNRVAELSIISAEQSAFDRYVASLGIFNLGEPWSVLLLPTMRSELKDQRLVEEGCLRGSWDPDPLLRQNIGLGRLMTTVLRNLNLQVTTRYSSMPINELK